MHLTYRHLQCRILKSLTQDNVRTSKYQVGQSFIVSVYESHIFILPTRKIRRGRISHSARSSAVKTHPRPDITLIYVAIQEKNCKSNITPLQLQWPGSLRTKQSKAKLFFQQKKSDKIVKGKGQWKEIIFSCKNQEIGYVFRQ